VFFDRPKETNAQLDFAAVNWVWLSEHQLWLVTATNILDRQYRIGFNGTDQRQ
jgi:hypothetical protein